MNKKVQDYIKKQKSPVQEICYKLRDIIIKTFPGITEEMKWGVPVYGGGKFYIGVLRDHINLGFSISGLSKEKIALYQGTGKTMRHITIRALSDIDEKRIVKLLKIAGECVEDC